MTTTSGILSPHQSYVILQSGIEATFDLHADWSIDDNSKHNQI